MRFREFNHLMAGEESIEEFRQTRRPNSGRRAPVQPAPHPDPMWEAIIRRGNYTANNDE